ncbi:unnamed protein product, partial [marine sediment metagenome]
TTFVVGPVRCANDYAASCGDIEGVWPISF